MEQLGDKEKLVLSFLAALMVPWVIALLLNLFISEPAFLLIAGVVLSGYTLVVGFQKNGELENSIGGIFGQMTDWVIPSGISWWVPRPFGQTLRKISVAKRTLDRSVAGKNPFPMVKARDGGTVEVGTVVTWHVVNARAAANFETEANLQKQVDSLQDRGVRYFALYFDSDEGAVNDDTALSHQKPGFSRYLKGDTGIKDLTGNNISNDIREKAEKIGIEIDNVDVVDVNEPKEVQDARNRAAAEAGQAVAEKLDIGSVRHRILELMWGTSDKAEIDAAKNRGEAPLMSQEEATRTVRTARGDMEDINVGGDAGDFSKGAAIQRSTSKKGPRK